MADGRGFLGNIPWWGQLLAMVVLVVVLWYVADMLLFQATRDEAKKNNDKALVLENENRDLDRIRTQLADYKKALDLMLDELKVYRERIPEEVKISETLDQLQKIAKGDNLVLRSFKPRAAQPKDFYKEKPVEVQVGGTYAKLGKFYQDIAEFKRIVRVSDVDIKKATPQTLNLTIEASFTLTTFFASEADILGTGQADATKK